MQSATQRWRIGIDSICATSVAINVNLNGATRSSQAGNATKRSQGSMQLEGENVPRGGVYWKGGDGLEKIAG